MTIEIHKLRKPVETGGTCEVCAGKNQDTAAEYQVHNKTHDDWDFVCKFCVAHLLEYVTEEDISYL